MLRNRTTLTTTNGRFMTMQAALPVQAVPSSYPSLIPGPFILLLALPAIPLVLFSIGARPPDTSALPFSTDDLWQTTALLTVAGAVVLCLGFWPGAFSGISNWVVAGTSEGTGVVNRLVKSHLVGTGGRSEGADVYRQCLQARSRQQLPIADSRAEGRALTLAQRQDVIARGQVLDNTRRALPLPYSGAQTRTLPWLRLAKVRFRVAVPFLRSQTPLPPARRRPLKMVLALATAHHRCHPNHTRHDHLPYCGSRQDHR